MKKCICCNINKTNLEFGIKSSEKDGLNYYCRKCMEIKRKNYENKNPNSVKKINKNYYQKHKQNILKNKKEYRTNNPEKCKEWVLKERYNISLKDYNKLLKNQNNKCKICLKKNKLVVDHDHKTGKVRGLLCNHCNTGIGFLKENLNILKNSIKYLQQ